MSNATLDSSSTTLIKGKASVSTLGKKVMRSKSFDKSKLCSEISFKDFLDFLRTAYQVNDAIEENVNGHCEQKYLDWHEVAKNELINSLLSSDQNESLSTATDETATPSSSSVNMDDSAQDTSVKEEKCTEAKPLLQLQKTKSLSSVEVTKVKPQVHSSSSIDQLLKRKLNEMIQEGLLDSILPYVVPKTSLLNNQNMRSCLPMVEGKKNFASEKRTPLSTSSFSISTSKDKVGGSRRKSTAGEPEVEIHVCDEVKNLKRDFRCPQKLLVSKMGYFAQVTTGQKLEDMDISVHCDITIFDWLMRWVKQGPEDGPTLDPSNVVPILVSAAFLQMDPLLEDCLVFCRKHMGDIIQSSSTLTCLNDILLTRLANMFSNTEVEALRDRRDKISSRLYCKLIQCLAEPKPDTSRGHYATLASLYHCVQCGQLVMSKLVTQVPCTPSHMRISTTGILSSTHSRDPNWSLSDYIRSLWSEMQSWRLVYWRLWGVCHFLHCTACDIHFPASQAQWCRFHPEEPQYFTKEGHRTLTFPIGRYPCCGERSYRFQPVLQRSGCQFREHQTDVNSERDLVVHSLYSLHHTLIAVEPPELQFPHRLTRLVTSRDMVKDDEPPWWDGIEIVPPRPRYGILGKWEQYKLQKQREKQTTASDVSSTAVVDRPVTASVVHTLRRRLSSRTSSTVANSSSEDESEDSEESGSDVSEDSAMSHSRHGVIDYDRSDGGGSWVPKQSTRANQDMQRDIEETQTRHMASFLARRTSTDLSGCSRRGQGYWGWKRHTTPTGSAYVKLDRHSSFDRQQSVTSRYRVAR